MKFSNPIQSIALIAATVLLAACGGNGGTFQGQTPQYGGQTHVSGSHQTSGTPDQSSVSGSQAGGKTSVFGGLYSVRKTVNNRDGGIAHGEIAAPAGKLDVLRVNGQSFSLLPDPALPKSQDADFHQWEKDNGEQSIIGKHLQYARYGLFATADTPEHNNGSYLFSQGERSATLPENQVLTYQGRAFMVLDNEEYDFKGTSKFDVDFGKKTLNGTLSFGGKHADIRLNADIKGNRFYGTSGRVLTEGGFYGADAAELAGTFYEQDVNGEKGKFGGAFGAAKQK